MSVHYPRKKILVSLHGIRTRGEWQKELCPLVSEKGWKYYPLDYGYFSVGKLAIYLTHERKISWFRDKINKISDENPNAYPSIIVHSFGSLILAKALKRYPDLKFDKVILTGSIIPVDYPWENIFNRAQVSCVKNLVGKADFWSKLALLLPWTGAGNSGALGFNETAKLHSLENVIYEEFNHGDALHPEVYKARFVPFLENSSISTNNPKANYLTYVNPFHAACWSAVMYLRQYVERFYRSIQTNDFYYRIAAKTPTYDQLPQPPKGLVVVIPESPSGASAHSRDDFDRSYDLKSIVFSFKARGASFSEQDSLIYDIPSALENLSVYTEVLGNNSSGKEALRMFEGILRDEFSKKFGHLAIPPKVIKITEMKNRKESDV
ncbi:MAG: hypothetical protein JJT75_02035 [Opitutales bacterium]|nr:hypothetical protein [Opitutales bacterium]